MGFEGANVIFDSWVHPLMMGLEEHLIGMFREDFEFSADQGPSHLGGEGAATITAPDVVAPQPANDPTIEPANENVTWTTEAQSELKKIPFFVHGKARRNTENFAAERGVMQITIETLYDAKAHFGR